MAICRPRSVGAIVAAQAATLAAAIAWGAPPAPEATSGPVAGATAMAAAGPSAAPTAAPAAIAPVDPEIEKLRRAAARVRELMAGTLAPEIEPASLFPIALDDERAVQVEARRLRAILEAERAARAEAEPEKDGGASDAGVSDGGGKKGGEPAAGQGDAGADAGGAGAAGARVDPLYEAQLGLDRARLEFLSAPLATRSAKLAEHAARRREASEKDHAKEAADRRIEDAAEARRQAEEELARALSEAARVVAEERARLLGVREEQARFDAQLLARERDIRGRAEVPLTWRRRVAELVSKRGAAEPTTDEADRLYAELTSVLRDHARVDLGGALSALGEPSQAPGLGESKLDTAGAQVDRSEVERLLAEVRDQDASLRRREAEQRWAFAQAMLEQVESLNRDRLVLYPLLSSARRDAITGLTTEGIDQAQAEVTHLALVLRYHVRAVQQRIAAVREGRGLGVGRAEATLTLLKALAIVAAFLWSRKRIARILARLREQAEARAREHPGTSGTLWAQTAAKLLSREQGPGAFLALLALLLYVAGPAFSSLLEVRILWIGASWILGGAIAVNGLDALAAPRLAGAADGTGELRLRSLRLLGRVVVGFGLLLALCVEIVGKGTIYSWVWTISWLAWIPVLWVVVAWWRQEIFERLDRRKRTSRFAVWALSRSAGLVSFPAAFAGGAYLLARGTALRARSYLGGFDLTRRALAYWFRRGVTKQAREREPDALAPLDEVRRAVFDPDVEAHELVSTGEAERLDDLLDHARSRGGVFALVGERGRGKSTLLRKIEERRDAVKRIACPPGGLAALRPELRRAVGLSESATDDQLAARLSEQAHVVLVDDAQRLVQSRIGGFADLDALLAFARRISEKTAWVLAVGAVTWRLVERVRGARPLFDDVVEMTPWKEEQIGDLLRQRSALAGVTLCFEGLVAEPLNEDEVERAEQLAQTEIEYRRVVWDHARGNPAVALYFFGESLRVDAEGRAMVQLFSPPETVDLERHPDPTVFTLRALLQLEVATEEDIVKTTGLGARLVADALRYCLLRGYLELSNGRYRVHWAFFRAISDFLVRRHLVIEVGKP
ncbi:MAG: AAA family ATPase [Polyangiaceae bacterium]